MTLKKFKILDETPIVTEVQIAHWQWIILLYVCHSDVSRRNAKPLLLE
jgi:primosomal protein N' (replication factor Y)